MDHITHEMRLANWKSIIEQCHTRPEGKTIKQWLSEWKFRLNGMLFPLVTA